MLWVRNSQTKSLVLQLASEVAALNVLMLMLTIHQISLCLITHRTIRTFDVKIATSILDFKD